MKHDTDIHRALRRDICRQCHERPPGSERWPHTKRRPCEAACQIFVFLENLKSLAKETDANGHREQDHVLSLPVACGACNLHDESGHCQASGDGTCPLCRYSDDVIATLQRADV